MKMGLGFGDNSTNSRTAIRKAMKPMSAQSVRLGGRSAVSLSCGVCCVDVVARATTAKSSPHRAQK